MPGSAGFCVLGQFVMGDGGRERCVCGVTGGKAGVPVQHCLRACHCLAIEQSFAHSPVIRVAFPVPTNVRENFEVFLGVKTWCELSGGKVVRRKDDNDAWCIHCYRHMR